MTKIAQSCGIEEVPQSEIAQEISRHIKANDAMDKAVQDAKTKLAKQVLDALAPKGRRTHAGAAEVEKVKLAAIRPKESDCGI